MDYTIVDQKVIEAADGNTVTVVSRVNPAPTPELRAAFEEEVQSDRIVSKRAFRFTFFGDSIDVHCEPANKKLAIEAAGNFLARASSRLKTRGH